MPALETRSKKYAVLYVDLYVFLDQNVLPQSHNTGIMS